MRTTIELNDDARSKLLALAARRGDKGFSKIVQEALDRYLHDEDATGRRLKANAAIAVLGTLPEKAAAKMDTRVQALREHWR